jgi:hypothetical protein
VSWSTRFAEPILLPGGERLATLRQAIAHLGKVIPEHDHEMPAVLTASDLLTKAADGGGPVEFARIATLRAINRHAVPSFNPDRDRKDTHWGKPKLKRDR